MVLVIETYSDCILSNPNNICKTGIMAANENNDNIVEKILNNRFNINCHL
jgi:hypothetical protein